MINRGKSIFKFLTPQKNRVKKYINVNKVFYTL